MDPYRKLYNNLHRILNQKTITVYQGIVTKVDADAATCTCDFGNISVPDIRLRASLSSVERQMIIIPKIHTAVVVGSLTGDLSEVVVLAVDEVEKIIINGGQLGGLIDIGILTDKINELIDAFNTHTHSLPIGAISVAGAAGTMSNLSPVVVPKTEKPAAELVRDDYEDKTITH